MSGVVSGGWEFVIAAYAMTALVLGGYAVSVLVRYRAERRRPDAERRAS
jgi:heme exporter protein CcmD